MSQWRKGLTRVKIEEELTRRFERYPGISFSFSQLIRDNVEEEFSARPAAADKTAQTNPLDELFKK